MDQGSMVLAATAKETREAESTQCVPLPCSGSEGTGEEEEGRMSHTEPAIRCLALLFSVRRGSQSKQRRRLTVPATRE